MILLIGTRDPAARLDLGAVRDIEYEPEHGIVEGIEATRDDYLAVAALVRIRRRIDFENMDFTGRQPEVEATLAYITEWSRINSWHPIYVRGTSSIALNQRESFSFWDEHAAIHMSALPDALGGLPSRLWWDEQGLLIELPWGFIRGAIAASMQEPFKPADHASFEDPARVFESLHRLYTLEGVRVKMAEVFETE